MENSAQSEGVVTLLIEVSMSFWREYVGWRCAGDPVSRPLEQPRDVNSTNPPDVILFANVRLFTPCGQLDTCWCKKVVRATIYSFLLKTVRLQTSYHMYRIRKASPFAIWPPDGHLARLPTHAWRVLDSTSLPHAATRSRIVCPLHHHWNTYFHLNHVFHDFDWIPLLFDVSFRFPLPTCQFPTCQLLNSWLVVPGFHTGFRIRS